MSEIILILLILNFIHGIGTWKLYKISGNNAFHSFIPLYNVFVLLKIINRPWWWIFIILMPVLNTIIIPVIWVELSRSFKKNSYTDTFLSICTFGFYNYYLNYFKNIEYVQDRDINPKSSNGEWTSSIIFACLLYTSPSPRDFQVFKKLKQMKLCVSIGLLILLKTCILPRNITINLSIKKQIM